MKLDTIRFGEVEIDPHKILEFKDGIPGMEEERRFAILQFEESNPIYWLQSVESKEICMPVIDSFHAIPSYAFDLGDEDVKELGLLSAEDVHVLSILVIPDNIEQMTANLAAPIVINTRTGQARQIILSGGDYNVRFPVFEAICRVIREGDADVSSVAEGK